MSLVYLAGTNPWLPLFVGFDEEDSGESAGEVTEQLDVRSKTTAWPPFKPQYTSSCQQKHGQADPYNIMFGFWLRQWMMMTMMIIIIISLDGSLVEFPAL